MNAGEVELLDVAKLQEQLLGLVWRGSRIDHQSGEHDDFANAAAGAVWAVNVRVGEGLVPRIRAVDDDLAPLPHESLSRPTAGPSVGDFTRWLRSG